MLGMQTHIESQDPRLQKVPRLKMERGLLCSFGTAPSGRQQLSKRNEESDCYVASCVLQLISLC